MNGKFPYRKDVAEYVMPSASGHFTPSMWVEVGNCPYCQRRHWFEFSSYGLYRCKKTNDLFEIKITK